MPSPASAGNSVIICLDARPPSEAAEDGAAPKSRGNAAGGFVGCGVTTGGAGVSIVGAEAEPPPPPQVASEATNKTTTAALAEKCAKRRGMDNVGMLAPLMYVAISGAKRRAGYMYAKGQKHPSIFPPG
ncbi:MAG: hypothetical protein ACR2P4_04470 [Gammaproteobacteria bacterium]